MLACASLSCGEDAGSKATDGGLRDGGTTTGETQGKSACYAAARKTDAGLDDEAKCVCDKCLDAITACNGDAACSDIRACMQRTGCGATSCYVGPGLCKDVIDKRNAMSLSFAMAQRIDECAAAMSCKAEAPLECKSVATFRCDGDEDCGGGAGQCCARFDGVSYVESRCASSCAAMNEADAGPGAVSWAELCHPGDPCANPKYRCLGSELLPSFLYRCRDTGTEPPDAGTSNAAAGRVSCGSRSCGEGRKCCVREPKAPYCAASDEDCSCGSGAVKDAGPDASGEDAGDSDAG